MERYGSAWDFRRIAITEDDLSHLPHFDTATKKGDVRYQWFVDNTDADPRKCWELDAMDPNDLRERVRTEIEAYMDHDTWQHALKIEAAEKASMLQFHAEWTSCIRGKVR